MKLWLLRPIDDAHGPWDPWYDKNFGFIIRADSEDEARELALNNGDETYDNGGNSPWRDPLLTTCEELKAEGEPEIIIVDFHAA